MSASGGASDAGSSSQDAALTGQGEGKGKPKKLPNPVNHIVKTLDKKGSVQVIDYYYDHEKGDHAEFELRPADGGLGHNAVFTVTRSASSSSKGVLDISQVIPKDLLNKFTVEKKLKPKFYRVKLKKKESCADLDLAKYFGVNERQLSSSDEEHKSS